MDDFAKGRYNIILGRNILELLLLNLKLSEHIIKSDDGPLKVSVAPVVDLGTHEFRNLNRGKITSKESLMKLQQVRTYNKQLHTILDSR